MSDLPIYHFRGADMVVTYVGEIMLKRMDRDKPPKHPGVLYDRYVEVVSMVPLSNLAGDETHVLLSDLTEAERASLPNIPRDALNHPGAFARRRAFNERR
jgi:hypothetical protein